MKKLNEYHTFNKKSELHFSRVPCWLVLLVLNQGSFHCTLIFSTANQKVAMTFISSADPKVSSAELMVLLICPSSVVVRPSTFALNRYSSYSSYSIILNFLLEKLGI